MSLLVEDLKNRLVVRVAIRYVLTAFGVVFSVALLNGLMPMPDWTLRLVAGIAYVALPFVLVMTWAMTDTGPQNLKTVRRR